jgi:hypothetical protein
VTPFTATDLTDRLQAVGLSVLRVRDLGPLWWVYLDEPPYTWRAKIRQAGLMQSGHGNSEDGFVVHIRK